MKTGWFHPGTRTLHPRHYLRKTKMYYVVHFHADGGQMCTEGRRCFEDQTIAEGLAAILKSEPGYTCGPLSVRVTSSQIPVSNHGWFDIRAGINPGVRDEP